MTSGYLTNPLVFLIDTFLSLYLVVVALRLLMPWIHWNAMHPLPQLVVRATEPVLSPLRSVLPRTGRLDTAVLCLLFIVALLKLMLVHLLLGLTVNLITILPQVLAQIISLFVLLFTVTIIIEVLLSWFSPPGSYNPVQDLIVRLNALILNPIRRKMPQTGGLDLSPLIAIIGLQLLAMLVIPLLGGTVLPR